MKYILTTCFKFSIFPSYRIVTVECVDLNITNQIIRPVIAFR